MDAAHWLLLLNAALSLYNCGSIWQAQRVAFPLFGMVAADDFAGYHGLYKRSIGAVVIVPSNLSLLTAVGLVFVRPGQVPLWAGLLGLVLIVSAAALTFALEIPDQRRLQQHGKSDVVLRKLIGHNWPRTLVLTAHGLVSVGMLAAAFGQ
jgi:hypothetical protein